MSFDLVRFTDVLSHIVDNRGKTCPVGDSGLPLIATNCINGIDLYPAYDTTRYVSKDTYATWFRGHPIPGDILFVCKGSPGRTSLVPDPVDFCIAQDMVAVRADDAKIDSAYLFAALRSKLIQDQISNMHVGTLIPHFKKGDFDKLMIPLPQRSVQEWIGDYYLKLSKRINLLKETNKTLESIAQAIFKSWFIDFDPVRAKMEGRAPAGMDEETLSLFPDELVESELGLVPKGWSVHGLDQIAAYLNGLALQKFPPTGNDDLPVIKIAQLRKGDTIGADKASRAIKPEYIVKDGDVLFSWSGSLEVEIWCGGEGALNQHLFKVTSEKFSKWFYYLWTRKHLEHFRQVAASKATTMGHIQRSHLSGAKVVVPSSQILQVADSLFQPIIDRITENSLQAKTLAEIRLALLPRLISGRLRHIDERTGGAI